MIAVSSFKFWHHPRPGPFSAVARCAQGCRQYPRHCPFGLQSWGPSGWTGWSAWTVASEPVRQAGGGGAAGDISSLISGKHARYRKYTISVYCDIAYTSGTISRFFCPYIRIFRYFLQYLDHIGPDIGEKPNIGFGKERVCPDTDIDPIS